MLELKQAPLMVNRGYSRVLAESYNLLTNNFKKTFRHMWIYSLFLSCALALYFMFTINTIKDANLVYALASLPLVLIATILFYSRALIPLNGKSMKWNSLRVLKFGAAYMILVCLLSSLGAVGGVGILKSMEDITTYLIYILSVSSVIALLLVPYMFISMKYYMEPQTHIYSLFFSGYKTGIKYWGFLFITILLAGLAMACIAIVVSLPLIIVYIALFFSLQGELNGDDTGMPGYINAITFIAATITYFITTFMFLYTLYISYYLYGSIETREKEKKEMTKNTAQQ